MDKAQLIKIVTQLIKQHTNSQRIWLYGSQVSGETQRDSDIDIAFEDGNKPDLTALKLAVAQLPTLIKVDIHNLSETGERFANRVRSTGRALYSADKKLRAEDGLHNFINALCRFESIVNRQQEFIDDGYGDVYLDLAVKRFEFTYEMAWKAIKRHIQYLGMDCKSPRACFTEAYAQELIFEQSIWLDMIEMRNRTSHVYDESEVSELLEKLDVYLQSFTELKVHIEKNLNS